MHTIDATLMLPRFDINTGEVENSVSETTKEFSIEEYNFVKADWVDNKYSDYIRFKFNNVTELADSLRDVVILGFYPVVNPNLDIEVI